jgi:hypothetical protein
MNRYFAAKALAGLVGLAGLVVAAGWVYDITLLKSISPAWVTMKFTTAVSFQMSGIILYCIATAAEGDASSGQVAIPAAVLVILLLMATQTGAACLGVRIGVEELFVPEKPGAVMTAVPGRPSLPTMLSFLLVAAAGILMLFGKARFLPVGLTIAAIGLCAIIGYITGLPFLYFSLEGWNTAMALHTAALFVLTGAGLALTSRRGDIHEHL